MVIFPVTITWTATQRSESLREREKGFPQYSDLLLGTNQAEKIGEPTGARIQMVLCIQPLFCALLATIPPKIRVGEERLLGPRSFCGLSYVKSPAKFSLPSTTRFHVSVKALSSSHFELHATHASGIPLLKSRACEI